MSAPRLPYYQAEAARAPRVRWPMHPAVWFIGVWVLVLALWTGLSGDSYLRITGSERQFSLAAGLYLGLALAAFVIGTLLGPDLLYLRGRPSRTPDSDPRRTTRVLAWATLVALIIGGSAIAFITVNGLGKAGGPGAFVDQLTSGVSWSRLADQYFISSRVQGLTIWVQINAAVGVLATLGRLTDDGRTGLSRWFIAAWVAGFVLSVLQSFGLSDRLATNEYIVSSAVAFVGYRLFKRQPIFTRTVLTRAGLVLTLMILVWAGGEYGRTYLARYGPALVDEEGNPIQPAEEKAAQDLALDRLVAYLVTSPNNALYTVDNFENHTYVYRTLKGVFTTAQIDSADAPLFGPGIREQTTMLREFYRTPEYTVYSFPGYAYMDLSWGGILICFWFGLLLGAVHYRFAAGELWALLIYPLLFVGVLDSWRIFYWSESRMLTCVAFLAVTSLFLYAQSRAGRRPLRAGHPVTVSAT